MKTRSAAVFVALILVGLPSCAPRSTAAPSTTPSEVAAAPPTLGPTSAASPVPAPLSIMPLRSEAVGRYELVELEVQTTVVPENPYDPTEFEIRVAFTSPSGSEVEIGAFWYQAFDPIGLRVAGEPGWRVRFTPTEPGEWSAVARVSSLGVESAPLSFRVVESDNPGFVRVHPRNPRYLAFDDGRFFLPIGLNMGWWSGAGTALGDYSKWIRLFASNGGNTIRVWMAEWSFGLEWKDTGLGDYDLRLKRAWMLDQIFDIADERDVYIDLVLLNCADLNNWQTNGWNQNPYNAARGGPLDRPEDFASDPEARAYLQRKLNYIVNRWGYSPHLLAWEWWNEVNLTPISDEALIPWLQEMTAYLRSRDVNHHLTTNSYAIRYVSPIWDLPELDVIQRHEYATQVNSPERDIAGRVQEDLRLLAETAPPKPILLGEFGYGGEEYPAPVGGKAYAGGLEKTGIHLHNGIWATTFAGYAGPAMYWFWDVYVEANNLWHHFRPLEQFFRDLDLTEYEPSSSVRITGSRAGEGGPYGAVGLGLRGSDDYLVWLRSDAYTTDASFAAWLQAGSPGAFVYSPPLLQGLELALSEVSDGTYTVRWYDPQRGVWMDSVEVAATGNRLTVPIPDFRRDLAAKIEPVR